MGIAHRLLFVLAGILSFARADDARALEPGDGIAQFKHTKWTIEEGAPTNISAIAQTPDGYLWMAAVGGVYRFDGLNFELIAPPAIHPERRTRPSRLMVSKTGVLWVVYSNGGGAATFQHGRLIDMGMPNPPVNITRLFEVGDGTIWFVSQSLRQAPTRYRRGIWDQLDASWGLPVNEILSSAVGPDGTLWLATAKNISFLPRGASRVTVTNLQTKAASLATDRGGHVWLTDKFSTRQLPDTPQQFDKMANRPTYATFVEARRPTTIFDRRGDLWGSTSSNGIFRLAAAEGKFAPSVDTYDAGAGLTSDETFTIFEDREGNIWVGSEFGLDQFRAADVVMEPGIPASPATGMYAAVDDAGVVFILAADKLYEIQPGHAPRAVMEDLVGTREGSALCPDRSGGMWLVLVGALMHRTDGRWVPEPMFDGDGRIASCAEDRLGRLWFGHLSGLRWRDARGWRYPNSLLIDGMLAYDLVLSESGSIMTYANDRYAIEIKDDRLSQIDMRDRPFGRLSGINRFNSGYLLGGGESLIFYKNGALAYLSALQYPWLSSVRGAVQSPDGYTWLSQGTGIVRVLTTSLERAFNKPGSSIPHRLFDQRDGLASAAQHVGFRGPQLLRGGDGRIWLLTSAGVARINPARLVTNELPPPVSIRSLTSGTTRIVDPEKVRLGAGTSAFEVGFAVPSLSIPQRNQVRYRLEGVDAGWVDPGSRRAAFYTNLKPGDYRFAVIASNNDGVWNLQGASLSVSIPPTFWQTNWFLVLCALPAIGLLWLLYALRVRVVAARVRTRMEERSSERERIAREVHDTLLQSIQALILRFQAVANRMPKDQEERRFMEEALDRADEVVVEGRDRVRDLRVVDRAGNLQEVLREIACRQAFGPEVEVHVTEEGVVRPVHPLVVDEIARIASEALFNAARYSGGSRIDIILRYGRRLEISFEDNGVGIDDAILAAGQREGHYGLPGMRERAGKIEASLLITRRERGGTAVTLQIPGRIAYYRVEDRWPRLAAMRLSLFGA